MGGTPLVFFARTQRITALSSGEAEYMAATELVRELLFLRHLLQELKLIDESPSVLNIDNRAALVMSLQQETKRSRHIAVRHHEDQSHGEQR